MGGTRDDVEDLLLAIEVDAVQRLVVLAQSIELGEVDRQRFLETSRQYREAALANHQAMAPEVRGRLVVVLISRVTRTSSIALSRRSQGASKGRPRSLRSGGWTRPSLRPRS